MGIGRDPAPGTEDDVGVRGDSLGHIDINGSPGFDIGPSPMLGIEDGSTSEVGEANRGVESFIASSTLAGLNPCRADSGVRVPDGFRFLPSVSIGGSAVTSSISVSGPRSDWSSNGMA